MLSAIGATDVVGKMLVSQATRILREAGMSVTLQWVENGSVVDMSTVVEQWETAAEQSIAFSKKQPRLTQHQCQVLEVIREMSQPFTCGQLSDKLTVERSSVNQMLARLAERGVLLKTKKGGAFLYHIVG